MDERASPSDGDTEAVRLQADEHPLIEDAPPATPAEHCLRLMHLRAYDEAVRHAAGRDVLDVGCNTGYGTMRFAPVAKRVVGVDVSPRAIEAARERADEGRPEFIVTSGFALPFADASFDVVTSFQVLEHVPDPAVFLGELSRVTRPGGTVILATPNAATRLYPGMTPWNRFHVHEYQAGELEELLAGAFATVTVLGMFGEPELYETEIRRVDAARRRIRRKEETAARQAQAREAKATKAAVRPSSKAHRPLAFRIARAITPGFARAWVRSLTGAGRRAATAPYVKVQPMTAVAPATSEGDEPAAIEPGSVDLEAFLRLSVDDLWYASTDLERSMDLLAICQVAPASRGQ
jgi:ubiquinone/menaquinone biosynthesis C-methylase UbiE